MLLTLPLALCTHCARTRVRSGQISPNAMTYADAVQWCESRGYTIARIDSALDNDEAFKVCTAPPDPWMGPAMRNCWLGIKYIHSHNMGYKWYNEDGSDLLYYNWDDGEVGLELIPILVKFATSINIGLGPIGRVIRTMCRAQSSKPET